MHYYINIHNIYFYMRLAKKMRAAIQNSAFNDFKQEFYRKRMKKL